MIVTEKINPVEFLNELTRMDLEKIDNDALIMATAKTKLICETYSRRELSYVELTFLNGCRFYLQRMENELKQRGLQLVTLVDLLKSNAPVIYDVLYSYSMEELLKLVNALEELTRQDKSELFLLLKEKAQAELIRRAATGGQA